MDLRMAICDDEASALEHTRQLAQAWAEQAGHAARIETFPTAEAFLIQYEEDKAFDLLLLDIEMARMNGVALARTVRAQNREIAIVFLTGYADYIADGYDVEALHYLLKPITREKLFPVLDRAVEHLRRNERALLIASQGETVRIPLYEIRYVESRLNYVTVHAAREYRFKMPLKEIEGMLDGRFFRAGRSLLINLARIRRIARGEVELLDGEILPLPRGAYEPLNRAFIEYF